MFNDAVRCSERLRNAEAQAPALSNMQMAALRRLAIETRILLSLLVNVQPLTLWGEPVEAFLAVPEPEEESSECPDKHESRQTAGKDPHHVARAINRGDVDDQLSSSSNRRNCGFGNFRRV